MSTAEQDVNNNFVEEFLDDYFAESEEHLIVLRRCLLELEPSADTPRLSRPLLDELFRSFHSLKGISGMVGLREAEQLAHYMESYLRALRQGQIRFTTAGMDGLMAGTKMLEQVIACRRQGEGLPDVTHVIAQLEAITPQDSQSDSSALPVAAVTTDQVEDEAGPQSEGPSADGTKLWRFDFVPLPSLAEQGINVNLVRSRLQEIGELRSGVPRILPEGGIAFEFTVASRADESAFAALRECGLTYQQLPEPEPVSPESVKPENLQAGGARTTPTSQVVRVNIARLDELMRMVGDLVISRARLDDELKHAETELPASRWRSLQETNVVIGRQLRDLREGVMRVRMVPVGEIFERMRFVVRDVSREHQKEVTLSLSGQDTEIDKLLIERMTDPLMHLVRNAVSHGLETPDERKAAGKPLAGTIALRASTVAEMVVIEIEDDGRGIDRAQVAERAREMGLLIDGERPAKIEPVDHSDAIDVIDDAALLEVICAPGFSTREEADRTSGRGVGMAVVKNTVQGLGGEFTLNTELGRGTRFTIRLPVTLAIADALVVSVGGQKFAVPQASVREVIDVEPASVKAFENNEIIHYRGGVLPIVRLARLFGCEENPGRTFHVFIIGSGLNAVGIAVDRILGQREIVVRAITDPLIQVPGIAGATELGDGRVVLILDAAVLGKRSTGKTQIGGTPGGMPAAAL